jgi:hypothetical protein
MMRVGFLPSDFYPVLLMPGEAEGTRALGRSWLGVMNGRASTRARVGLGPGVMAGGFVSWP